VLKRRHHYLAKSLGAVVQVNESMCLALLSAYAKVGVTVFPIATLSDDDNIRVRFFWAKLS